jgi:pentatricopeptide repeat protein
MTLLERRSDGGKGVVIPVHVQYLRCLSTILCALSRGAAVALLSGCTGLPAYSRILEAPDAELALTTWTLTVSDVPVAGMNACVGVGRIEEATSILETMIDSGLRPDVRSYNILLKGLAGSKDLEGMQRLLDDMRARQVGASVVTYNIVVDAFAQEGRLEEVCDASG